MELFIYYSFPLILRLSSNKKNHLQKLFYKLDTGLFGLKIFAEVNNVPPASHDRTLEGYYININSFDFNGNLINTISGYAECKVPFYFELLS